MAAPSKCRYCRRPLRWITMRSTGNRAPVDFEPDPVRGNIRLERANGEVYGEQLGGEVLRMRRLFGESLFVHHAATCRRRRRR